VRIGRQVGKLHRLVPVGVLLEALKFYMTAIAMMADACPERVAHVLAKVG